MTGLHFVERVAIVDRMLDDLAALRDSAAAMPVARPVGAGRISSRFGSRRDPFLNQQGFHAGIDFAAGPGVPVRATASGNVVAAGWEGGYGNMVEIAHAGGFSTRYGHLSSILVSLGDRVAAGDLVGRVGSTGRSTGPHLHYETRKSGRAVDPSPFLAAGDALRKAF
jgi:murein DD-endopeptidase MepM/ murein hydrolase activator NlpD